MSLLKIELKGKLNMNNKCHLTLFRQSIIWLEKYIEVKELLPNWDSRKQTDTTIVRRKWDKNTPESEILDTLGTSLHVGFAYNGKGKDRKSELRKASKIEFYKWINATEIDNNCPQNLKKVLFAFHEVIESKEGGYKLHQSAENSKPEMDPDSPEYQKELQETFSLIGENFANRKAFEVDNTQFNGNAEAGKTTFEAIANSLSPADRENFHFWPQMSDEEKAEEERKNKERTIHPILQGKRTHALNEITQALHQEPQLSNNDLEPKNQNWKTEINSTEDIIKIQNIQNWVLADIKEKRQKKLILLQQQEKWKTTKTVLIIGATIASLSLIIVLIYYYWKKNAKRN